MNINSLTIRHTTLYKLIFGIVFLLFCIKTPSVFSQQLKFDSIETSIHADSLLQFAEKYLGTPYKLAGKTAKGFDCSGFVHHVYKAFNVKVPYSCPGISSICATKINKADLQKGDLLFFKGSNSKSNSIGHIAIVHTVDEDGIKMIHSCRRGVILESLNKSTYYKARYLFAKRLF